MIFFLVHYTCSHMLFKNMDSWKRQTWFLCVLEIMEGMLIGAWDRIACSVDCAKMHYKYDYSDILYS